MSLIETLVLAPKHLGRPRKTDLREVVNAVLSVASSDGTWRLLLTDLPLFSTVRNIAVVDGMLRSARNEEIGVLKHSRVCRSVIEQIGMIKVREYSP
ncbi:transposase [Ochrobactrum sp. CM-21-5]|nr:transposase [Ochrobactrum sp. CM-21-5]MBC2887141.1 transposase [Ochrobactrum sp. CM-21-5]